MTGEEQIQTGYSTLTPAQKQALSTWIDTHFTLDTARAPPPLYVNINAEGGKQLILSDQSRWEVDPKDQALTSAWISSFPVKIVANAGSKDYPYLLINLLSQEKVRVRPTPSTQKSP